MNAKSLAVVLILVSSCAALAAREKAGRDRLPAWLAETQTYCMVPVLPETAANLHVSVNGMWAGIGGTHPILTHKDVVPDVEARYGANPGAFVEDCRRAGLVICSIVNGLEGFPTLRAVVPDLDSLACQDAQGKPSKVGDGMLLMCSNNPAWVQWEIEHGKRGIDLGAESVLVDTPMSA